MALVNAWLHYHLVHNFTGFNKENARFKFMEALAQDFLNRKDWSNDSLIGSTRGILQELSNHPILHDQVVNNFAHVDRSPISDLTTSVKDNLGCTPFAVSELHKGNKAKYKGFQCQVCVWEGRKTTVRSVVICLQHRLRLCTTARSDKELTQSNGSNVVDYSWRAPSEGLSCWDKAHKIYIPGGLFCNAPTPIKQSELMNESKLKFQNVLLSSSLYKKRCRAFGKKTPMHGVAKSTTKYNTLVSKEPMGYAPFTESGITEGNSISCAMCQESMFGQVEV